MMRSPYLLRFFSKFHIAFGGVLLVPLLVELMYKQQLPLNKLLLAWLMPAVIMGALGFYLRQKYRKDYTEEDLPGLSRREGFLLVGFSWTLMIVWGTFPFLLTGAIPDLAGAIFESASGFTTTGATVLENIEDAPPSILLWRSLSHWIGGMGIIVLSVAILPELALGGMQLFSAEASGLSGGEKLAPRIRETASRLWFLYAALTGLETVLLMYPGGMNLFDAVNHAFATTATGGFSPNNASIGGYNGWVEGIITLFMILAGLNFALQYKVYLNLDFGRFWRSTEVRIYLLILAAATLFISCDLWWANEAIRTSSGVEVTSGFVQALRYAGFQVVAILTTTGFGTADFDQWPLFSKSLIVIMMAIGGCAGSTAGGLKIIRILVLFKHMARECSRLLLPNLVQPISVDKKAIDDSIIWGVMGFISLYILALVVCTVIMCTLPHTPPSDPVSPVPAGEEWSMDFETAAAASLSALNSIGPGLAEVGPAKNYAFVNPIGKLVLAFCMLLGRLEIYSLLILLLPTFWQKR